MTGVGRVCRPIVAHCGRSIGARCVAVPTGQTSADTLRGGQPDVLVDTLEDAPAVLALFDD